MPHVGYSPTTRTPKSLRMNLQVTFSQDKKNPMTIVAPPPKLCSDLRERGEGKRKERGQEKEGETEGTEDKYTAEGSGL